MSASRFAIIESGTGVYRSIRGVLIFLLRQSPTSGIAAHSDGDTFKSTETGRSQGNEERFNDLLLLAIIAYLLFSRKEKVCNNCKKQ